MGSREGGCRVKLPSQANVVESKKAKTEVERKRRRRRYYLARKKGGAKKSPS